MAINDNLPFYVKSNFNPMNTGTYCSSCHQYATCSWSDTHGFRCANCTSKMWNEIKRIFGIYTEEEIAEQNQSAGQH